MALLSSPIAHNHTHMLVACSSVCVCVCARASLHANVHKCETLCKQLYVSAAETAWEDKNIKEHSKHKVARLYSSIRHQQPALCSCYISIVECRTDAIWACKYANWKSRNSAKQCNWLKKWFLLIVLKHLCESGLDKWYAVSHSWFATLSKAWLICWLPAKAVN